MPARNGTRRRGYLTRYARSRYSRRNDVRAERSFLSTARSRARSAASAPPGTRALLADGSSQATPSPIPIKVVVVVAPNGHTPRVSRSVAAATGAVIFAGIRIKAAAVIRIATRRGPSRRPDATGPHALAVDAHRLDEALLVVRVDHVDGGVSGRVHHMSSGRAARCSAGRRASPNSSQDHSPDPSAPFPRPIAASRRQGTPRGD